MSWIRIHILFCLLWLSVTKADAAPDWDSTRMKEMPEWSAYFTSYGISSGTFVFYDQQKAKYLIYNKARFEERFIPASTFKIFNSLAALEAGAVKSTNESIGWDGFDRNNVDWNKTQNMKWAYAHSTVWVYQELARRIGFKKMQEYIDNSGYGNKDISGGIDNFWLNGKLRISAREQVEFLKKLQSGSLPFKKEVVEEVKKLMIEEETPSYILRAKTGWGIRVDPGVGWYVGYVEKVKPGSKEKTKEYYYFAINFTLDNPDKQLEARKMIPRKILTELKVL